MKQLIKILILSFWLLLSLNTNALASPSTSSWTTQIQTNTLKLISIDTIYDNQYKLIFNNDLFEQTPFDIKIMDKSDPLYAVSLSWYTLSWSTVNVTLNKPLKTSTEYAIIVMEAYDTNWEAIWAWVDAEKSFITPNIFDLYTPPVIKKATTVNTWATSSNKWTWTNIELNSASDVNLNSIFKDVIPEKTVTSNTWVNNTFETAKTSKKLPTTWPAEWLLLSIALFFWLIIFTFKARYKS